MLRSERNIIGPGRNTGRTENWTEATADKGKTMPTSQCRLRRHKCESMA